MKFIIILFLCILFIVGPASAITYEDFTDPTGLGYYSSDDMLLVETASSTGTISTFDYLTGNTAVLINDLSYPEDAVRGQDGYVYFVLKDGRVFKCTTQYGMSSFVDDYDTSFVFLGDMDSYSIGRSIIMNGDGDVLSNSKYQVFGFYYPSYSMAVAHTRSTNYAENEIQSLAVHDDGYLIGTGTSVDTSRGAWVDLIYFNDTKINLYTNAASGLKEIAGIYSTDTNDVYFSSTLGGSRNLLLLNYSDSYSSSTVSSMTSSNTDVLIDSSGIIYVSFSTDDTIKTYATIDLSGGFFDDGSFSSAISTDSTGYEHGDTVNVIYDHNVGGYVIVQHLITGNTYHLSDDFTGSSQDETWSYYIPSSYPTGLYNVYLMADYETGDIIDAMTSYTVSPASSTISYIDVVAPSTNLYENIGIAYRTMNESILSIINPLDVEVFNETVNSSELTYTYYTPVVNAGTYTVYLHDDTTLSDTFIAFNVDAPDVPGTDPDSDTNETIIEDIIEEDESMTEYYNEKFRDFAPTIWGFFVLMCLLFLMSILTSFNSGGKR